VKGKGQLHIIQSNIIKEFWQQFCIRYWRINFGKRHH